MGNMQAGHSHSFGTMKQRTSFRKSMSKKKRKQVKMGEQPHWEWSLTLKDSVSQTRMAVSYAIIDRGGIDGDIDDGIDDASKSRSPFRGLGSEIRTGALLNHPGNASDSRLAVFWALGNECHSSLDCELQAHTSR